MSFFDSSPDFSLRTQHFHATRKRLAVIFTDRFCYAEMAHTLQPTKNRLALHVRDSAKADGASGRRSRTRDQHFVASNTATLSSSLTRTMLAS